MFRLRILEFLLFMFIVSSIIAIMNNRENIKNVKNDIEDKYKHHYNDNVVLNYLWIVFLYILKTHINIIYYISIIYKN